MELSFLVDFKLLYTASTYDKALDPVTFDATVLAAASSRLRIHMKKSWIK
jgi:hypothetical protein